MDAVEPTSRAAIPGQLRWLAALGLWLSLALLPFGAAYEVGCALCLAVAAVAVARGWRPGGQAARCFGAAFGAYLLAAAWSLPDAVDPPRAWLTLASSLRYGAYGLAAVLLAPAQQRVLLGGAALVVALWTLDALLQAITGMSLGGPMGADRLSGIFGADDLKLGPALAVCAPLLLALPLRLPWWSRLLLALAVALVVLLAGARAGWISFGLAAGWWLWRALRARGRRVWPLALAGLLVVSTFGGLFYLTSARFAERIDRTLSVLSFDRQGLDRALAWRLPIWENAAAMARAYPVNGVGVRGFRTAYLEFADPGDRHVLMTGGRTGAFHPHHLVLEILCETGVPGLLLWLGATLFLLRAWWRADAATRQRAWPYAAALVAMSFPLNTHLAFYSSFWGTLCFWLLAMYCAALAERPAEERP